MNRVIRPPSGRLQLTSAAPVRTTSPTLAQLLARKKPRGIDLARFLAAIAAFDELGDIPPAFQGARSVPIPLQVITMMGEFLGGRAAWSAISNTLRAEAAARQAAGWQARADEIWASHPGFSTRAVAKIISPDKFDAIRRKIIKPKK